MQENALQELPAPAQTPSRLLLVESNKGNRHLLASQLFTGINVEADVASSLSDARKLIENNPDEFFVAVANVRLKDAINGEIVALLSSYSIPVIALSTDPDDSLREKVQSQLLLDYVSINSREHFEHVEKLVKRIQRNYHITVLLVESSDSFRFYVSDLLRNHRFNVITATSSHEALQKLEENPNTKLMVTDSSADGIDGAKLIKRIRQKHKPQSLAIVGISPSDDPQVNVQLLKAGASDYLRRPFAMEEFYCRINQNIEILEYIEEIQNSMIRDYLTDVYNRRYLYEAGEQFYLNARRGNLSIAVAMIDADKFKEINDTYGHDVGDDVLVKIASTLRKTLRTSDIVARFGGEEFVCIINCIDQKHIAPLFERVRAAIESLRIHTAHGVLRVTASIGVTMQLSHSLDGMINLADQAMYKAKQNGRNRVVLQ